MMTLPLLERKNVDDKDLRSSCNRLPFSQVFSTASRQFMRAPRGTNSAYRGVLRHV
jgi:hypothetical protein